MTKQTARTVALRALLQVGQDSGYSNIVLDRALDAADLNGMDKGLASAVFYGVLEKRLTLDYYIAQCLRDPKRKPDRAAMEAIRCGAYQILFMDRVPDPAAVNETVQAVKAAGRPQLAGFVNGVLRGLLRKRDRIKLPAGGSLKALSIRCSVPEELIRLWCEGYGKDIAVRILDGLSGRPELFIRINRSKCSVEQFERSFEETGVRLNTLKEPAYAAVLENCGAPDSLEQFREGLFHVQDLSAQWVCRALDPRPGETVCDCCAAPGGKSFTIAQEVGPEGRVYALDLHEKRVSLITSGARRLGLANICAKANDALQGLRGVPMVDKMLCDVPCSGFGVIKRKPEIRYKDMNSLRGLPQLQYDIIKNSSYHVKPGGVLIYSTCTLNPAENSAVAERFLRENNGFEPMNIDIGVRRGIREPDNMLTMMPFAGGSDGFFVAAFRKKTG